MNSKSETRLISVGIVVVAETAPAVLYSLAEVFSLVGVAWEMMTGKTSDSARMHTDFVAAECKPLECAMGALIRPQASFADKQLYDIVIASDMLLEADFDPRGHWPDASAWIQRQYAGGALVASVCTGIFLLAEAGILDGREATTHWGSTRQFHQFYPQIRLKPEKVLSLSGTEHRIVTAGGASSWSELALYLISNFCGAEAAAQTAKVFLLGDRSEGQLPFAAMARPRSHEDAVIDRCQAWIAEHYAVRNPVAQMAAFSGLNERTFKRRFRAATGYSPIEYVQTLRIEEAKHWLETTGTNTDEIASEVGYDDPATFRRLFKRLAGITPAKYRQRYQCIK